MAPEDERRGRLHEAIREIVVTRERTPRSPRWAAAWRRTLLKYVDQLNRRPGDGSPPASPADEKVEG